MSWGKGVALALFAFIAFIATLVTIIIRQKVDLVTDDYYKNEIAFQEDIDARKRGSALERFQTKFEGEFFVMDFPAKDISDSIHVVLFRPNDQKMDQYYSVKKEGTLVIPKEALVKGNYQIECFYFQDGKKMTQLGDLKVN